MPSSDNDNILFLTIVSLIWLFCLCMWIISVFLIGDLSRFMAPCKKCATHNRIMMVPGRNVTPDTALHLQLAIQAGAECSGTTPNNMSTEPDSPLSGQSWVLAMCQQMR